jgi:hypothetical protein
MGYAFHKRERGVGPGSHWDQDAENDRAFAWEKAVDPEVHAAAVSGRKAAFEKWSALSSRKSRLEDKGAELRTAAESAELARLEIEVPLATCRLDVAVERLMLLERETRKRTGLDWDAHYDEPKLAVCRESLVAFERRVAE